MKKILTAILLMISVSIFSQEKTISGTVSDKGGQPLPGASVIIKGTTIGTQSDFDGNFTLNVADENATLVISYIGFSTKELLIANQTTFNVTLEESAASLDEIVLVGYGTTQKRNLTGAVASLKSEDITRAPVSSTSNALAGRMPGLITKQSSGEPGNDAANISIRGFGNALIIVDGVEQSFNDINPNEIENISILKDASAAIYGARAGNGVVLITTKKGKFGKPKLTLRTSTTMQSPTMYPEPMNAGQYAEVLREAQLNAGRNNTTYSEEDVALFYSGASPETHPNTDWYGETYRNWSPMTNHELSLSGGTENTKYFGFLGYLDQEGLIRSGDNKFKRYNVRLNLETDITDNLTASFNLSGIFGELQRPNQWGLSFYRSVYDALPTVASSFPDETKTPYQGFGNFNPLAISDIDKSGYTNVYTNNLVGGLVLEYDFPTVEGLSMKGQANYKQITTENKSWSKEYETYNYNAETDVYTFNGNQNGPTKLTRNYNKHRTLTGQLSLNYDRTFDNDHTFKGLVLLETIDIKNSWFNAGRQGFTTTTAIDYLFAGDTEGQTANGSATEAGRSSLVGRVNYNYKGKYFLEGIMRYDGSANFASAERWGLFPSVSAAWRISEEPFFKDNVKTLSNLKIRTSIGNTGRDNTGQFQYITGYQLGGAYAIGGDVVTGINTTGLANPNITWESMTTYNAGLDFSLFNNKLYSQVDVFYRLREGILATRGGSLPNTFGAALPAENINSQDNRGYEFVLGYKGSIKDFKFDISGNFTKSRAKWVDFNEAEFTDPDDIRILQQTGRWTDVFIGYVTDGLFTSQDEIDNYDLDQDGNGNSSVFPGDIKYVDLNGDGVLDNKDRKEIGKGATPLISYGLNLSASYKGISLDILLQGAADFNMTLSQFDQLSLRNYPEVMFNNRWTPENNDANALFARQALNSQNNKNRNPSTFYMKDASYLRVKNISIGYDFPSELMEAIKIDNLRVFLSGTNLFTFSELNKYDLDPEALAVGGNQARRSGWYYPQQRTISMGLEVKF